MGFPHPTPDLPGKWPALRAEVMVVQIPTQESSQLLQLLDTDAPELLEPAHICATAWVFSQNLEQILLVQHSTLGWSMPGGHLNQHETSKSGALRELLEETGLDAAALQVVGDAPAIIHQHRTAGETPHQHWNIGWLYVGDSAASLTSIHGAQWWLIDELPIGPDDRVVGITKLLELLAPWHRDKGTDLI